MQENTHAHSTAPTSEADLPNDPHELQKEHIDQNTRLIAVLGQLEQQVARQASFKLAFLRGMVYGLGTVIGATVLIALLGGLLAGVLTSLQDWPLIGPLLPDEPVEEYIDEVP